MLGRWLLAALVCLGFSTGLARGQQEPADIPGQCGSRPISIAAMPWPSAQILAEIHASLLAGQFGCTVQVVPGDLAGTGSSMGASGQPAIAPELWIARIADIWNGATKAGAVRQAAPTFGSGPLEDWMIPGYSADAHPDIRSLEALAEKWADLAGPDGKLRLYSCPSDWACAVINANLVRALGLADHVEIVEPADRFELDSLIAGAISRQEPFVLYYWQPNGLLDQFSFQHLDMGAFDRTAFECLARKSCEEPRPSAFASEPVVIAVAEWVMTDEPVLAAYLTRASMPLAEMNHLLAALSRDGATPKSVAEGFVRDRQAIWGAWVGTPTP